MDDKKLKYYTRYYFANELPVPFQLKYNNYLLYIKPITVQMFPFYQDNVGILQIDKNRENNVDIIQMSYLQYLVERVLLVPEYQNMLTMILNLSLGDEFKFTMGHDEKKKVFLGILNQEGETLSRISPKEFDKISEIIMYYNDPNYDNRYISEDLRNAMNDYYNIKFANQHIPTLEEKKAFLSFKSGLTLQEINNMSYRFFEITYDSCVKNDLFFSQRILQASEKYKVDDLVYPLFKKKESKFDFLQNADNFERKVSAAAKS